MIKLGVKGRDKITGFVGIVTGKITWITGCDQYSLAPEAKDNEFKESHWFDEARIEVVGEGITLERNDDDKPGGDWTSLPPAK